MSSLVAGTVLLCAAALAAAHEDFEANESEAKVLAQVLAVAKADANAAITSADVRTVSDAFARVPKGLIAEASHWTGLRGLDAPCRQRFDRLISASRLLASIRGIGEDDAELAVLLTSAAEADLSLGYVRVRSRAPAPEIVRLATRWVDSAESIRRYLAGRLAFDALEFGVTEAPLCGSIVQRVIDDRDPIVASTFVRSVGPSVRDANVVSHLAKRAGDVRSRRAVESGIFRGAAGTVGADVAKALVSIHSATSSASPDAGAVQPDAPALIEWAQSLPGGRVSPDPGRWKPLADRVFELKVGEERVVPTDGGAVVHAKLESYADTSNDGVPTYRAGLTVRIGTAEDGVDVRVSADGAPQGFDPEAVSLEGRGRGNGARVRVAIAGHGATGAKVRLWVWEALPGR